MKKLSIEVNGKKIRKEVPDHTILSVLLRRDLTEIINNNS